MLWQAYATTNFAAKPQLTLTILHTNDLHAHDEEFVVDGKTVGGFDRIGYLIKSLREKSPNTLVIDAGDIFQGTPFYKLYQGATEVEFLNQAGYDIYTIGNHEFDNGPDNLAKQLAKAKFAVINANLDTTANPALGKVIKPSVIKVIDGQKVGFIGAVTPDLSKVSLTLNGVKIKGVNPEDFEEGASHSGKIPDSWMNPIREEVKKLNAQGVNKIILVTHVGVELDKQLAEAIPQVDAIIGGHSHTFLKEPIIVQHPDGSSCVIVQAGCYGRALGDLTLSFDSNGKVILPKVHYDLLDITDRVPKDKAISDYLAQEDKPVIALRKQIVGFANGEFSHKGSRTWWDSPLGDLITDAIAEEGSEYGADIAFENRGGMRGGIEKGPITKEEVDEILPFENHLIVATVAGSTIWDVLEHSLSGHPGDRFFDEHGLKLAFNQNAPEGHKLVFILAKENGEWKPLNLSGSYRIAVNDYSFGGGEGYNFAQATNIQKTQDLLSDVLLKYLAKHPKITPSAPSRIAPVADNLLSEETMDGKRFLVLKSPLPMHHVVLMAGTAEGVEPMSDYLPAPLANAEIVQVKHFAEPTNQCKFFLPLDYKGKKLPRSENQKLWVSAIIQPTVYIAGQRCLIAMPIKIENEK